MFPASRTASRLLTRRRFSRLVGVACLTAALAPLMGCGEDDHGGGAATDGGLVSRTVFAFDTVVTLKAACDERLMQALCDRCMQFESLFSRTIATSDIGRINAARGAAVEVAPETADLIEKALRYCEESAGRFDITIGAVSSLWDFKKGIIPEPSAIEAAVQHVGYSRVHVDGSTVRLSDPDAKLDLGGIAKGYIADDLCKMLVDGGCASGFVNLGGNVRTVGVRPDGTPWRVGVQDPNDERGTVVGVVDSRGSSVVTSGLYERSFEQDGNRYWHILDPKTGYPAQTDLVSATVFSSASIDGDGYTKPLFMMGLDEACSWIAAKDGIEALLIGADGRAVQTDGANVELR